MISKERFGGVAGMIAGPLLVLETGSFLIGGWNPIRFADPLQAQQLLRSGGGDLRMAAVFGFAGLVLTVCLLFGLAERLRARTPALADAVLYLALVGIAGHALVPLGLWIGIPMYLSLGAHNPALARSSWEAFAATSNAAEGVGSLFMGLSMFAVGVAAMRRACSAILGSIAAIAGVLTLVTLLSIGTPLATFAGSLFLPALAATVLFRFIAGVELWAARPAAAST